jgi:hypothetical protein
MNTCLFKQGDFVIYRPSRRGHGLDDAGLLEIGKTYRVERIEKENYVVVEGYRHPGGGIYWTEFAMASDTHTT